jgi:hypothetical protein
MFSGRAQMHTPGILKQILPEHSVLQHIDFTEAFQDEPLIDEGESVTALMFGWLVVLARHGVRTGRTFLWIWCPSESELLTLNKPHQ